MHDVCIHVVQIRLYLILYITIYSLYFLNLLQLLTSLCWMSSGKEFAASFYGGAIGIWNLKSNKAPEKIIYPHGNHLL